MKSIVSVGAVVVVVACAMAMGPERPSNSSRSGPQTAATATYEHLATAIIALRETEDSLVRGMMEGYLAAARAALDEAGQASGPAQRRSLEQASAEIANLANEGDKRIQAVRQRLLKAGHHHHTDAETEEDYMFIDSAEKAALLELAGAVAQMRQASPAEIRAVGERLTKVAKDAMRSE